MGWELLGTIGFLTAALGLVAAGAYARPRQRGTDPATDLGPWREGGFYRLTGEEQRAVRKAVRRGEAVEDPRLAEAAWRMAAIAHHNRGRNRGMLTPMAVLGAQACVMLGLAMRWEWLYPVWGALIAFPLVGLCLALLSRLFRRLRPDAGRPHDRPTPAARAITANRALLERSGRGADSGAPDQPEEGNGRFDAV